jgi:hypothetical protein
MLCTNEYDKPLTADARKATHVCHHQVPHGQRNGPDDKTEDRRIDNKQTESQTDTDWERERERERKREREREEREM